MIPENPIMEKISGYSIVGSIDGLFVSVIEAGWCKVLHQSTDFLIIGIFTKPIKTSTDINLSAFSKLVKELCKDINPRYIINKIKVDVIRASHCHHVPHVGIPHIEPDIKAIKVTNAPTGAIDLIIYAANLTFQIKKIPAAIAITIYKLWDRNEAGTWRYIILNEFPWT